MKIAGKEFLDYWNIIKIPTLVLIAWSVIGVIISALSLSLYFTIFTPISSWIITIAAYAFIGWIAVKDHKEKISIAAISGAISGIIVGLLGAVVGIFVFYFMPGVIEATLQQAGVAMEQVKDIMQIGVYIGLITGPLVSGILGTIFAAITGFIAKKV